jgi:hypothetical protein
MQKSFFARLFNRPLWSAWSDTVPTKYALPAEIPVKAKETPRQRVPSYYVTGNHWVVIYWSRINNRWDTTETIHRTQADARKCAKATFASGVKTRVVKALIPTS